MPTPALSLPQQMLRRRPVSGAPVADGASDHLQRSLGTFLLTMFGVGETVGAGIFIVLSQSVPQAGPAVVISFHHRRHRGGSGRGLLRRDGLGGTGFRIGLLILLRHPGRVPAMGVAACLLLEYGVSTAAVAVGWSQYLNKLLDNVVRISPAASYFGGAVGFRAGCHQPAGDRLGGDVCGPVDPRCQSIREGQRRDGGDQAHRAGDIRGYRVHRVQRGPLQ